MTASGTPTMGIGELQRAYAAGDRTPIDTVDAHLDRVSAGPDEVWITHRNESALRERAQALPQPSEEIDFERLPLYGIPFAVKDNIDHDEMPTTAGCPAYERVPDSQATVVERLVEAGAILTGKTNMDQFATGLVGTRTPYGVPPNAVDSEYIPGGSSSGSGVAVALEQVSFALGTDTAGSGRVPAALNGIVGLKPTRGLVSTDGVVPACKSLDCVSVFANSCPDALLVARSASGFDPDDEYSRRRADSASPELADGPGDPVVGVPQGDGLEFFGDEQTRQCFEAAVNRFRQAFDTQPIDLDPFLRAGRLLYQGPWVAERLAAVQPLLAEHPDALLPITREIITRGRDYDAMDAYNAEYKLRRLTRAATAQLEQVDAVVAPTTGTTYTREAIAEQPVERNSNLGYYTNFMNLLDLAAVAVPGGRRSDGLPVGVTVFGPAWSDGMLASISDTYCRESDVAIGADGASYSDVATEPFQSAET